MQKFNNLIEAVEFFNNDSVCRAYLEQIRWKGKPYCPHCNHDEKIYKFKDNKTYKCSACKKKFTVTVGSIFENTNLPIKKWLIALYLISSSKKGITSPQLARTISVKQQTAWFMLQRIREMLNEEVPQLEGIIEVDETYIGGINKNRHYFKRTRASY